MPAFTRSITAARMIGPPRSLGVCYAALAAALAAVAQLAEQQHRDERRPAGRGRRAARASARRGRAAGRSSVRRREQPQAQAGEADHEHQHDDLGARRRAVAPVQHERAVVREHQRRHVTEHERRDLHVPDRRRRDDAVVDARAGAAEQVRAVAERVGCQPREVLAVVGEQREVVRDDVGREDRCERVRQLAAPAARAPRSAPRRRRSRTAPSRSRARAPAPVRARVRRTGPAGAGARR